MIIKELDASFGKLAHQRLSLKDGLNVVYAPNESGKSTWCAFIRAMLYGIDTSQRDKAGFLSDKTKFRPWSGAAMEGTMIAINKGREIAIQRTALGSAPMRRVKAIYVASGENVPDVTGEMLTGATEEIFYRTAFIGQTSVKVNQSADLERRIMSIVSSGSEDTSYSQIDARLRTWQRKLRYNRTGSLPALEQELSDAEKRLSTLELANDRLSDLKNELTRLEAKEKQLKSDLETHKRLEARAAKRRVLDARKTAEQSRQRVMELREIVTVGDRLITKDEINKLRGDIASLEMLKIMASDSFATLERARDENSKAKKLLAECEILGKDSGYVSEQAKRAEEFDRAIKERSGKKGVRFVKLLLTLIGGISAIAAPVMWFVFHELYYALGALALCVLAIGGVMLLPKPDRNARAARDAILQEFNMLTVKEFTAAAKNYSDLAMQVDGTEIGVAAAEAAFKAASEKEKEARMSILENAAMLFGQIQSADELLALLNRAEETLGQLSKAEFSSSANTNIYAALLENYDGDPDDEDDDFITQPLRDSAGTYEVLNKTESSVRDLRERYNLAQGHIRAMGDPVILNGEIRETTRRIEELKAKYDALTLAIQTLKEADSELQTRFSPVISKIAGEYMSRMTAGRYEKLLFDKSFDAMAKTNEDSVSRNVLSLSRGTADQLYLSLRLAMCELILGGDEPCPIILDDALVSFDDERLACALDLLTELGKKRQIIMFSCHSREADYFNGRDDVNVIRMKRQ